MTQSWGEACYLHSRLWNKKEDMLTALRNANRHDAANRLDRAYAQWIADGYALPDRPVPTEIPKEILDVIG
jgi:hypothetical protein